MKINAVNNNYRVKFGSHLTKNFRNIIEKTNPAQVEKTLGQMGISADFQNSKPIAACTMQTVNIFNTLNLSVPKRIVTLDIPVRGNKVINGIANPNFKIGFNTNAFYDFEIYNKISDIERKEKFAPTDHFLVAFLHEFAHNENFSNIKKANNRNYSKVFTEINNLQPGADIDDFILKRYGFYPRNNFIEIFADVMTNRIANSLDNKTLLPNKNPFTEILSDSANQNLPLKERNLNRILRDIYFGDYESLKRANINSAHGRYLTF